MTAVETSPSPASPVSESLPLALRITPDDELKRVRLVRMKRVASAMLVAVVNLAMDCLYGLLDPRIRHAR